MSIETGAVLTVDLAVLTPGIGGWEVLLTKRGKEPHRDAWALPGGKVGYVEPPDVAVCRELAEETGVSLQQHDLMPLAWYADPNRDPRGRYISLSYVALLPQQPTAQAGSDAADTRWWPLDPAELPTLAFDHETPLTAVRRLIPRDCPGTLTLRRPVQTDTSAVIDLHHHALNAAGANAGPGPWDEDLEDIPAHYLHEGGEFVIGSLGGFLLAMGALRHASDDIGEIKRMRVHPRWQGRGFGRRVLEHLERRATELGYRRLILDTTEDQHAALSLYRRHGYRQTGEDTVAGLSSLLFEKRL
ncbi:GNAT family N-acetyltransferase [Actinopolyspora mortivallis]|uniref:GNAT family N-acetyltransferase n=1 Tax=Actinopolyspora mortivallis TaxID=33906 RepID=UPI0011B1F5A1|nr:GNAT family N-acetyltransferase [Actinopolyspora mortivallis]